MLVQNQKGFSSACCCTLSSPAGGSRLLSFLIIRVKPGWWFISCLLLLAVTDCSFIPHPNRDVCSCRMALVSSSLLPSLSDLLDDPSSSCRRNVHLVLNGLAQLPGGKLSRSFWSLPGAERTCPSVPSSSAGADAVLKLVPKLMLKLREMQEEEEEEVLLLSTLTSCSRLDPRPTLVSGGIPLIGQRLSHCSRNVRREAAAVLIALRYSRGRGLTGVCVGVCVCYGLPLVSVFLRMGSGRSVKSSSFLFWWICCRTETLRSRPTPQGSSWTPSSSPQVPHPVWFHRDKSSSLHWFRTFHLQTTRTIGSNRIRFTSKHPMMIKLCF